MVQFSGARAIQKVTNKKQDLSGILIPTVYFKSVRTSQLARFKAMI
jgi:hypothetical protein